MPFITVFTSDTIVETGTVALQTTTTNGALESTQQQTIPYTPIAGEIWAIPVSGSAVCHTNLTTADKTGIIAAISASSVFCLTGPSDMPVWYRFSLLQSGGDLNSGWNASGSYIAPPFGAAVGTMLHQGSQQYFKIPVGVEGMITSGSSQNYVSLSIVS